MSERVFWSADEAAPDPATARDALVARAVRYGCERSREIRERVSAAGVDPEAVAGIGDLEDVPVLAKEDLPALQADDPPFGGMLAVPLERLRRLYRSPGPILDPEGRDEDFWRVAPALWAAGFRPGHLVLNTLSYHLTPGGHMLDAGLRAVGCVVIPGGVGNSAGQVRLAGDAGATGYTGTPGFLLTLAEHARAADLDPPFTRALVTGGPLPPPLRARLSGDFGIEVFQLYGTADAGTLAYECEIRDGWHVSPALAIEILAPGSGEPVPEGEAGEVVVTSPNDVYPLVRFGTGDLSSFLPGGCACGRTTPRLSGFLGRVGEGVKVRGMFVHPRQLAAALDGEATVARYHGVVTAEEHRDVLTVRVEPAAGAAPRAGALAARVRESAGLRIEVDLVAPGTIPEDAPPLEDRREHGGETGTMSDRNEGA